MKKILLLIILHTLIPIQAQNNFNCTAFSEGCWTLIGANNGVELYVTHKKIIIPTSDASFIIEVHTKLVNTNDYPMKNDIQQPKFSFNYYELGKVILTKKVIGLSLILSPKQTIVTGLSVRTAFSDVQYDDLYPLEYNKII